MVRTISVKVSSPGGAAFGSVDADLDQNVLALKQAIQRKLKPDVVPCRQRLTIPGRDGDVVLDDLVLLGEYLGEGQELFEIKFKVLPPQISFIAVYILEYLGPLLIYPLFALRLVPAYGNEASTPLNTCQIVGFLLWTTHYTKRILESIFVHNFGTMTMPILPNLPRNCLYYYLFGALIGYSVNYPTTKELPSWHLYLGFPWFCTFMFLNLMCHLRLKYMRPKNSNAIVIPRGGLFEYITCPNYFCEIMTWFGFNIVTGFTIPGVTFNILGAIQMSRWSIQRRERYKKMFGNKWPRKRWVLYPFIF